MSQTLAREYPSFYGREAEPVEELDVDRWSLAEAIGGVGMRFSHLGLDDYDEDDYWEDPEYESAADRAYDVLRRLEERYGSPPWWRD